MTRFDSRFGHLKHGSDLSSRKLFEVPHHEDFTIVGCHFIQSSTNSLAQLFAYGPSAGARSTGDEAIG